MYVFCVWKNELLIFIIDIGKFESYINVRMWIYYYSKVDLYVFGYICTGELLASN